MTMAVAVEHMESLPEEAKTLTEVKESNTQFKVTSKDHQPTATSSRWKQNLLCIHPTAVVPTLRFLTLDLPNLILFNFPRWVFNFVLTLFISLSVKAISAIKEHLPTAASCRHWKQEWSLFFHDRMQTLVVPTLRFLTPSLPDLVMFFVPPSVFDFVFTLLISFSVHTAILALAMPFVIGNSKQIAITTNTKGHVFGTTINVTNVHDTDHENNDEEGSILPNPHHRLRNPTENRPNQQRQRVQQLQPIREEQQTFSRNEEVYQQTQQSQPVREQQTLSRNKRHRNKRHRQQPQPVCEQVAVSRNEQSRMTAGRQDTFALSPHPSHQVPASFSNTLLLDSTSVAHANPSPPAPRNLNPSLRTPSVGNPLERNDRAALPYVQQQQQQPPVQHPHSSASHPVQHEQEPNSPMDWSPLPQSMEKPRSRRVDLTQNAPPTAQFLEMPASRPPCPPQQHRSAVLEQNVPRSDSTNNHRDSKKKSVRFAPSPEKKGTKEGQKALPLGSFSASSQNTPNVQRDPQLQHRADPAKGVLRNSVLRNKSSEKPPLPRSVTRKRMPQDD